MLFIFRKEVLSRRTAKVFDMSELLPSRQHNILITLVQEFISTAEPVGSSTLVRKYDFPVSSATMRNEMARLEEQGFLMQPHTSAGRIPTDRAYRYYVDFLMRRQIPTPREVERTLQEYGQLEVQLQRLLDFTVRILADTTHYTSLVLVPTFRRTMFRYLKITPLEGKRLLLIILTNTGAVLNKIIQLSQDISDEQIQRMTNILNERLANRFFGDIYPELLRGLSEDAHGEIINHIGALAREALLEGQNNVIYDGTKHLLNLPEFQDMEKLKVVFEMLEDEKVVVEILKKTLDTEGLKVLIGHELSFKEMQDCSLVTATYGTGETPVGTIAVMGPTRMPYSRIIPVVNACAEIFSEKISRLTSF